MLLLQGNYIELSKIDFNLCRAEVCSQKAEVGEGAERLSTDFCKDLEYFCLPSVPIVSMGYNQKHFYHYRGRPDHFQ
jgi:hypothetical protein